MDIFIHLKIMTLKKILRDQEAAFLQKNLIWVDYMIWNLRSFFADIARYKMFTKVRRAEMNHYDTIDYYFIVFKDS